MSPTHTVPRRGGRLVRRSTAVAALALVASFAAGCAKARQTSLTQCMPLAAKPIAGVCPAAAPPQPGTAPRGGGPVGTAQPPEQAPPPAELARDGGLLHPDLMALDDGGVRVGPGWAPVASR